MTKARKAAAIFCMFSLGIFVGLSGAEAAPPCRPSSDPLTVCYNPTTPQPCSAHGTTTMDGDGKNIIACLKDDSGKFVWKAMTAAAAPAQNCPAQAVHEGHTATGYQAPFSQALIGGRTFIAPTAPSGSIFIKDVSTRAALTTNMLCVNGTWMCMRSGQLRGGFYTGDYLYPSTIFTPCI